MAATSEGAPQRPDVGRLRRGYAAATFAVIVWAGWIVATRNQVGSARPLDLAILRYGIPALALAPVWLRRGIVPAGERQWPIWVMAFGWGGPFVLLTGTGLQTVPASLFGPMVPATLPLYVAAYDVIFHRARLGPQRIVGLLLIALSISLIVGPAAARGDTGFFQGAPWLMAAALGWAAFTIAYRSTRFTALEATAYTALYSVPFLTVMALLMGSDLGRTDLLELGRLALVQGALAGVGAAWAYGYAIRELGVPRTSSLTSLVPMGAALGGWALLEENPGPLGWLSVVAACLGVATVNGAFHRLFGRPPPP